MESYDVHRITDLLCFNYLNIAEINNYICTSKKNHEFLKISECINIILNILCKKSYIDNSDLFYRIGGIKYIISCINNNFQNKKILTKSFCCITNIIFKNDINKIIVYSYGINDILVKSLKLNDNNFLVSAILKLFSNLVIRSNEVIYDIMHNNNKILCIVQKIIKSENINCFHNGLRFIQNITCDKSDRSKNDIREYFSNIMVNNKNIIDLLFDLLQKFYSNRKIIINNFVRALLNLIKNIKIRDMAKKDNYINILNNWYSEVDKRLLKIKIKSCLLEII